jgi:lipid-binding SYLF domain-containing protein
MFRKMLALPVAFMLAAALLPGTVSAQKKEKDPAAQRAEVHADVVKIIDSYKKTDPGIDKFFKNSAGYAVFPRVGKAGFIVGGGAGDGELFEKGKVVGFVSVGFGSVGLQIGVQEFSEIIFFESQAALERFKQNKFEFAGGVSLVIVKAGGADAANYRDGVVVFAKPTGGAMAEASVGTQKFTYKSDAKK